MTSGRGTRSERGSQLIEFGLVLPLLLLVVLGIMDFGLMFQKYEAVTNAAREGARIAALDGYEEPDVVARVEQYLDDAGLNETPITIYMAPSGVSAGGVCITMTGATVFYPNQYLFLGGIMNYFAGGSFGSKMLSAKSIMRFEGPADPAGC